jgi:hypothetical protein
MKDEFTERATEKPSAPVASQVSGIRQGTKQVEEGPQEIPERLVRVEAALGLVLDHLQALTEGTQILESQHSRSMLASIALGFSAVALLALWSLATVHVDHAIGILRFTIGMSLMFMAAMVDLASASLLRKAVGRAMLDKDPSHLVLRQGPWHRALTPGYWATLRRKVPGFFNYQIARCSALLIYLIALGFLIWAMILF